jgi:hypothetical protein
LGDKLRHSWGAMLKPAAFTGRLCFAPGDGQLVRFTRPDRWLPAYAPHDPDDALRAVARRYLAAYGPATRDDVARWWGTQPAPAERLMRSLDAEVATVEVDGARAWMLAGHTAEAAVAGPSGTVRLVPAFDPYVVAASPHADRLLPGPFRGRVYRPQGWISPVVLVDGRMAGVWRHERKGERLLVSIEPFGALPAWAQRAAEGEAARLATFVGGRLELTWAAPA